MYCCASCYITQVNRTTHVKISLLFAPGVFRTHNAVFHPYAGECKCAHYSNSELEADVTEGLRKIWRCSLLKSTEFLNRKCTNIAHLLTVPISTAINPGSNCRSRREIKLVPVQSGNRIILVASLLETENITSQGRRKKTLVTAT